MSSFVKGWGNLLSLEAAQTKNGEDKGFNACHGSGEDRLNTQPELERSMAG